MFRGFFRLFNKNKIHQSKGNNNQSKGNLGLGNLWSQINHRFFILSSALTARIKDIITSRILPVKTKKSLVAKIAIIQAAARLVNNPDKTLSQDLLKSFSINLFYHNSFPLSSQVGFIKLTKHSLSSPRRRGSIQITQAGFIKFTKRSLISLLIFWTVVVGTGLLYLFNPFNKSASAVWFDDNWGYRKAITVTVTTNAADISNLETLLTVDTTGITAKLQTSCQDLRFTNTNGKLLPYYIDTCSDNSATNEGEPSPTDKIWVMADLVPKNGNLISDKMEII